MKILITIANDLYVRNYLETGAFSDIDDNNCFYLANGSIKQKDILESRDNFIGYYTVDPKVLKWHMELLNILMWRYRKLSKTFYFRFLMLYWPKTANWSLINKPKNILREGLRYVRALKYPILGSGIISGFIIPFIKRKLEINRDIIHKIRRIAPDLIIFPTSAYDAVGIDLARLSNKLEFKSLFLIDNWDNLSSKSVLWARPDFLAVWGEQSREHAIRIHGMRPEQVYNIGTPRFEKYFSTRPEDYKHPYGFDYILFCGCSEPFDELTALRLLDEEIKSNRPLYPDLKVIYRPHPKRQQRICPDHFKETDYANVILDKQAAEYYDRQVAKAYQPKLDYYPSLLFHAKMVVAPLTTMVIEALVCGKPVLGIAYDDEIHFTSPHNILKYATHVQGIEKISGLQLCKDKQELGNILRNLISDPKDMPRSTIHSSLRYFLYHDSFLYADRLRNLVDRIVTY